MAKFQRGEGNPAAPVYPAYLFHFSLAVMLRPTGLFQRCNLAVFSDANGVAMLRCLRTVLPVGCADFDNTQDSYLFRMLEDIKKTLWTAAGKLRAKMDATKYKQLVFGLIFVKYITDTFAAIRDTLLPPHDLRPVSHT
jgi:hypothetical protein